jgi:class 3 adenylate cyclase
MGAARRDFVVIALGDRDAAGYDERALPLLIALVDSTAPDTRVVSNLGVVSFFLLSERGIAAAKDLVSQAEILRDRDPQFASLGIGTAHGPLIADFDSHGRVKADFVPVGEAANRASRRSCSEQNYRECLGNIDEAQIV